MQVRTHSLVVQAVNALRELMLDTNTEAELDLIEKLCVQQTLRILNKTIKEVEDGQR